MAIAIAGKCHGSHGDVSVRIPMLNDIIVNMQTRGQRLKYALSLRGVSGGQVDRVLSEYLGGKKTAGYTSRIANDKRGKRAQADLIAKIAETLAVRYEWLEYGREPMEGESLPPFAAMAELALEGSLDGRLHPVLLAAAYHRGKFPPEAVKRVMAKSPSVDMPPEAATELLVEETQAMFRELKVKAEKRANAPPKAPPPTAPPATSPRRSKAS
jgi:hypothetical protein